MRPGDGLVAFLTALAWAALAAAVAVIAIALIGWHYEQSRPPAARAAADSCRNHNERAP